MNVVGKDKSGKTNLALTAPGPLAVFDYDYGMEGVINKFSHKSIYVQEYLINEITPDKYVMMWEKFKKDFMYVLDDKSVKSIITDTGTEMWELARLARFGKLTQVMPHNYGPVNAEVRALIRNAYSSSKNVIFLHKMTEQYVNDKPTGKYVMAGFKDMPYAVQINMLAWREDEGGPFHAEITNCRHDPTLVGMDFVSDLQPDGIDMVNFPMIAMSVFPGTTEEDWV